MADSGDIFKGPRELIVPADLLADNILETLV
jgi:hypothetical protein